MAAENLVVLGFATVEEEHIDLFIRATADMVALTRCEHGCLGSVVHQDVNDTRKFFLHEEWENQETWTKHLQQRHIAIFSDLTSSIAGDLQIRKFKKYSF